MSYEGYDEWLCRNGHYFAVDSMDGINDWNTWICPTCQADCAWWNMVDETNGEDLGPGFVELEIAAEPTFEKCNLGHNHMVTEARYCIPPIGVGHHRESAK